MAGEDEQSSTDIILEAVKELHSLDQVATRDTVAELTGLKLGIVDDRLRTLANDGRLRRLVRGVYEPVARHPPTRTISKTILDDGTVKYDIGDEVLTLTPQEARRLAELSVGAAQTAVMIQSSKEHLFLATELSAKVERLQRVIKSMRAEMSAPQLGLFDAAVEAAGLGQKDQT